MTAIGGGGNKPETGSSELPLTTSHDSRSVQRFFSPNDDRVVNIMIVWEAIKEFK